MTDLSHSTDAVSSSSTTGTTSSALVDFGSTVTAVYLATLTKPLEVALATTVNIQGSVSLPSAASPSAVVFHPISSAEAGIATTVVVSVQIEHAATSPLPPTLTGGAKLTGSNSQNGPGGNSQNDILVLSESNPAAGAVAGGTTSTVTSPSPESSIIHSTGVTPSSSVTTPANGFSTSISSSSGLPPSTTSVSGAQQSNALSAASTGTGHSTGDVVGAAVGCLIGGFLIAGILALFFLRRRGSRGMHRQVPSSDKEMSLLAGHGEAMYLGATKQWENHIPSAEPDSVLRRQAAVSLEQIEKHVETFYHDAEVHLNEQMSDLSMLESDHLPSPAPVMLEEARQPTLLIKHCIANAIISAITIGDTGNASLLPRDFATLQYLNHDRDRPGFAEAVSRWRVLTAYLRPNFMRDHVYQGELTHTADKMARELCQAFTPWARSTTPTDNESRYQSLVGNIKRTSELGVVLFTQPAVFEWQWQVPTSELAMRNGTGVTSGLPQQNLVILPGLQKVTDENAQALTNMVQLVEPKVVGLNEL